jgi:hypothetical protein
LVCVQLLLLLFYLLCICYLLVSNVSKIFQKPIQVLVHYPAFSVDKTFSLLPIVVTCMSYEMFVSFKSSQWINSISFLCSARDRHNHCQQESMPYLAKYLRSPVFTHGHLLCAGFMCGGLMRCNTQWFQSRENLPVGAAQRLLPCGAMRFPRQTSFVCRTCKATMVGKLFGQHSHPLIRSVMCRI